MKFYRFQILIERKPGGQYFTAYSPTLAGCFQRGRTLEEARHGIRHAVQQRLDALLAEGAPVSQSEGLLTWRS